MNSQCFENIKIRRKTKTTIIFQKKYILDKNSSKNYSSALHSTYDIKNHSQQLA